MNLATASTDQAHESVPRDDNVIPLQDFIAEFGSGLMDAIRRTVPPVYTTPHPARQAILDGLSRAPFPEQAERIHAIASLLLDQGEAAGIINGEMGTGKTMMGIGVAAVLHAEKVRRTLVLSPPHLVYKWRREILETVPNARVWVLNGPDTLSKLLTLRAQLGALHSDVPEFYILGRVRMRMGFHWRPAFAVRKYHRVRYTDETANSTTGQRFSATFEAAACPDCHEPLKDEDGERVPYASAPTDKRLRCSHCNAPLWELTWPRQRQRSRREVVAKAMCDLPTIGPKTAEKLLDMFGADFLAEMLGDNVYQFVNLMDDDGEMIFSDRQARRLERALAKLEFGFGQGGYQPSEFIKRYLPTGYFGLLLADEGHEYKSPSSAQGQAMGVLANKVRKVVLLTGTLMGGYADDLFYLLWRVMPQRMIEDGFGPGNRSIGSAALAFMREHGVLKDVYTERHDADHKTARGTKVSVSTSKAPGFGPAGIVRYLLPYTAFLRLKDLKGNVLPLYEERVIPIEMESEQRAAYDRMALDLKSEMRRALARGDTSLLGVVLNALLAWPDTAFRTEVVKHRGALLCLQPALYDEDLLTPKEQRLIELVRGERAQGRRTLVYTTYTGTRDTAARLKQILTNEGFKVAVLRSSVDPSQREDWLLDQVDRGVDVVVTNPELVKTGLDLLDFPSIVFMQSGYNVYTVMQAARRSWRIGQREDVRVYYLGYTHSAQESCLRLMGQKIAVAQSTSGEIPDNGLDSLNDASESGSVEMELARSLLQQAA